MNQFSFYGFGFQLDPGTSFIKKFDLLFSIRQKIADIQKNLLFGSRCQPYDNCKASQD